MHVGQDSSITVAFDEIPEEGLNNPLRLEKVANEVHFADFCCLMGFSCLLVSKLCALDKNP